MRRKILSIETLFLALAVEKILQHLITALFFAVDIKGVGKPDIGDNIPVSDANLVGLNIVFALIVGAGVFLFLKGKRAGKQIILWMAFADIVFEFLFHGFGYLTVSVLVSSAIVLLGIFDRKLGAPAPGSG